MSEDDIIIHLTNSFVAGSITVATSIGATLYFAMRDPRVYMKLVAEVRNLEQSVTADYAETIRMPYLQACIKEAMRLAPTNNLPLERLAPQEGIEVSGHFLPHGTNVGCSAFILHRDCSVYGPDIDTFRPERWIEGDPVAISRMQKHFFAFGRGERGCSGRTLAMMMMGKFIVQILRAMDVEWAGHPTGWNLKAWWMPEQRNYFVKFRSRSS
ncbi:cytochrome P450 [Viridothelium virens]|uniref:Cytochrome P450 n=1 Tax=Viridothelium virens TaxID=1048519 RepID=A0A6A6H9U3_VIRVR|nr:cytochrome P450 [Viridothelium virens]